MRTKVLIDTNVMIKAALSLAENVSSPESKIVTLSLEGKIRPVITLPFLEEYCRVAKYIINKDFSGWLRKLIIAELKPVFIQEEVCNELRSEFEGRVPKEDMIHFLACIAGGVSYLISNNREFLRRARNPGFKCVTPQEFLKEMK